LIQHDVASELLELRQAAEDVADGLERGHWIGRIGKGPQVGYTDTMLGKESEAVRVEVQLPEANCIIACLVRPTWFTYCKCAGTAVLIYRCPPSSQSISGPCRIPLAQSTSPNCLATTAAAEAMLRSSVTSISPAVTGRLPCTSDRANATTDVHNPHALNSARPIAPDAPITTAVFISSPGGSPVSWVSSLLFAEDRLRYAPAQARIRLN
jgi:hypothetical protein